MGSGGLPVKSTDVEMPSFGLDSLSQKLRHTLESCVKLRYFDTLEQFWMAAKRTAPKRNRSSDIRRRRVVGSRPPEEAGPDEAAAFMAEMLGSLARMARRHRLDVLSYLLSMAQLEAEEHLRLRSRGRLS